MAFCLLDSVDKSMTHIWALSISFVIHILLQDVNEQN